jgi:ABC-2 type transport system permease protein
LPHRVVRPRGDRTDNAGVTPLDRLPGQSVAIARRVLLEYWRQRRVLVFWGVFPALMLLLFGLIYRENAALRGGFDSTPAGILIGAALFFSCLGGTLALLVAEKERRTLRRLLVSPLHPAAYFVGVVLALSVVAALQAVLVFGLGHAIGARYRGSVGLGVLAVALSVVGYVGLGFVFGARFARRAEDINGPLTGFGVPLLVLGGTFFPLELLPDVLRQVAWFNPILHMNEALKGVSGRGQGFGELAGHFQFLFVFSAVALAAGIASYRRLLAEERRA